ncbi:MULTISPECIES: hypothetical protein [unclassified Paenibacillus]|uniref:hypothetical protein n=1 Tax=unclassified Paenibacillus TaxID=185978 RepID=UPI0023794CA4|nr:hypothetical protein [Paenibacillus sp. MAHUQ-63]
MLILASIDYVSKGVELKRTLCVLGLTLVVTLVVAGCVKAVDTKTEEVSPTPMAITDSMDKKIELAKTGGMMIFAYQPAEGDVFKGITVQTKEPSKTFSWSTTINPTYYPTITVGDFYTGGKDEIAIILTKGYGTGILQQELHVLKKEDLSEILVENPIIAIKKNVKSKITKGDKTVTVELEANGMKFKKEYKKSAAGTWNENVAFGDIVQFIIDKNKITAHLPGAVSPAPEIVATAVAEYGKDLKINKVDLIEEK